MRFREKRQDFGVKCIQRYQFEICEQSIYNEIMNLNASKTYVKTIFKS